jgi:hypothetical protein
MAWIAALTNKGAVMKIISSAILTLALALTPIAAYAQTATLMAQRGQCTVSIDFDDVATIEGCSTGGSGYTRITNHMNVTVRMCWSLEFEDGSTDTRNCRSFEPQETAQSSCFRCGLDTRGRGLKDAEIYRHEILD